MLRKNIFAFLFSLICCVALLGQASSGPGAQSAAGASLSGSLSTVVDIASQFGVKYDGVPLLDVAGTGGLATVSSASANWSSADIGKTFILFVVNGGGNSTGVCNTSNSAMGVRNVPVGTTILSVQNSNNITLSGNVITTGTNMCAEYGSGNEPAWNALDAFLATLPSKGKCPILLHSNGDAMADAPHFFTNPLSCVSNPAVGGGTVIGGGIDIRGWGSGPTRIVLTHKFFANIGTNCVNSSAADGCFVMGLNAHWSDFNITGLGESLSGTNVGTHVLLIMQSYTMAERMRLEQAGYSETGGAWYGAYCLPAGVCQWLGSDIDGAGSVLFGSGAGGLTGSLIIQHSGIQDSCGPNPSIQITNGSQYLGLANYYGSRTCSPTNTVLLKCINSICEDTDSRYFDQTSPQTRGVAFWCSGTSTCKLDGVSLFYNTIANSNGLLVDAGAKVNVKGIPVWNTGPSGAGSISNSGVIYDLGGNLPICTATCTFGTIVPIGGGSMANTIPVASRNTTLTATNLLSWGATPTTTTMYPAAMTIYLNASQSVLGSGCTTNTTITWTANWTDRTGTAQSVTLGTQTITNNGAVGGSLLNVSQPIDFNFGSAVTFTGTVAAGTCTTVPSYSATASLR